MSGEKDDTTADGDDSPLAETFMGEGESRLLESGNPHHEVKMLRPLE